MLETKKEQLEVKVIVGIDPKLTNFDHQKHALIFDITNETTTEVKNLITQVVSSSNQAQLESFVPFVQNVLSLQEIQNTFYDKDNEEESLKRFNEFNALTAAKRVDEAFELIYREAMDRKDQIVNLKKAFKDELKAKKSLLEENYKEYLDEKKRKADEAKAKKKAQDEAENLALKQAAEEAQEKAKRLEISNAIESCKNKISAIQTSALSNLNFANIDGLERLKFNIADTNFESYKPNVELEKEVVEELRKLYIDTISNSVKAIDTKIQALKLAQRNEKLEQQVPESINTQQVPQNFEQQETNQVPPTPQSFTHTPTHKTDLELVAEFRQIVESYTNSVKSLNQNLRNDLAYVITNLENQELMNIVSNLPVKSLPTVDEWMEKMDTWSEKVKMNYEAFITNNK
jgi:hypothetical protein